jgi:DNA topoisomerase-1
MSLQRNPPATQGLLRVSNKTVAPALRSPSIAMPGTRARRNPLPSLPLDPEQSALLIGLRYIHCGGPGFERRRAGKGFAYLDLEGRPIRDRETLRRIRSLALPPAWERVWISPLANGHLQATGVDARGRRQYRYHPQYRLIRNQTKFNRMLDFAKALPGVRTRVEGDLKRHSLTREKVVATVVALLERTLIRVGNEEYARENSSFGLTTLRDRHVRIEGGSVRFHFRGKSGQMHEITLEDKRLARIVRECRDLPGYELFQYVDEFGEIHSIDSGDVNGYLREISGDDFSAKDFRTWAGTVQTALTLAAMGRAETQTEAKRNIVQAIKETAGRLGNRPATSRNYYVHPVVIETYADGSLFDYVKQPEAASEAQYHPGARGLHPEEASVVELIRVKSATLMEALPLQAA